MQRGQRYFLFFVLFFILSSASVLAEFELQKKEIIDSGVVVKTSYEEYNKKVTKTFSLESDIAKNAQEESILNSKGYIIEFDAPSASENYVKLQNSKVLQTSKGKASLHSAGRSTTRIHDATKRAIFRELGAKPPENGKGIAAKVVGYVPMVLTGNVVKKEEKEIVVLGEWTSAINGIALDISPEDAEKVKKVPGIKKVTPNYQVKTLLQESIPFIGADATWNLNSREVSKESIFYLGRSKNLLLGDINHRVTLKRIINEDAVSLVVDNSNLTSLYVGREVEILPRIFASVSYVNPGYINTIPRKNEPGDIAYAIITFTTKQKDAGNFTGKGIKIAIIDTGVDYTHPDLGGCFGKECKVVGGYDFVNYDGDPMDDQGHGTHVAGTAAGKGDYNQNGKYEPEKGEVWGVAPDAQIIAYKVLNSEGRGYDSSIIEAINLATDVNQDGDVSDHIDIISMSLGGSGDPDDSLSKAVDNAVSVGVVAVIAAGNSGPESNTIGSPGTARKAITVGATYKKNYSEFGYDSDILQDQITFFSSRGPVMWYDQELNLQYLVKPDIVAPGAFICAARYDSIYEEGENPYYKPCIDDKHVLLAGTSMATPIVAGSVALLKQTHPDWTPEQIKSVLKATAKDLGYNLTVQGAGRIDLLKATSYSGIPSIASIEASIQPKKRFVDIHGVAKGNDFDYYTLEVFNENDWREIYKSGKQVDGDILYSNFDTWSVNEGMHFLRLNIANKKGSNSSEYGYLLVDRISIENVKGNDIYRAGDKISIEGTVKGGSFNVEFAPDIDEKKEYWSTEGITLSQNGRGNVEGVIAVWDTSSLNEKPSLYNIKITSYDSDGRLIGVERIENIYLDPTLKIGWPQRIEDYVNWTKRVRYSPGLMEPVVSDIDNDGKKEIFLYVAGNPTRIYAFKDDGRYLEGWPVYVEEEDLPRGNIASPTIADVDGDGKKEIIVNGLDSLYIYNLSGILIQETPLKGVGFLTTETVVEDINMDNKVELIRKVPLQNTEGNQLAVIDVNGNILPGWPQMTYNATINDQYSLACRAFHESSPSVADVDGDGKKEIIVTDIRNSFEEEFNFDDYNTMHCKGRVYVFRSDGTIIPGFPLDLNGTLFASPTIADVDGDGKKEIIVGTTPDNSDYGLYVINSTGAITPGWPKIINSGILANPAIIDVDNDSKLEIVASFLGAPFETYIFDYKGNILEGWPVQTSWNNYRSISVGDIDGDGKDDIVFPAGNGFYKPDRRGGVYGLDSKGNSINQFLKLTDFDAQAGTTIIDIDGDGKLEIVASSNQDHDLANGLDKLRGTIYVWNLNSSTQKILWPMYKHDTEHSGCYDCEKSTGFIGGVVTQKPRNVSLCTDSDGGIAFFSKGVSNRTVNGQSTLRTDQCLPKGSGQIIDYLIEFYCEKEVIKSVTTGCKNGCFNGACITSKKN